MFCVLIGELCGDIGPFNNNWLFDHFIGWLLFDFM